MNLAQKNKNVTIKRLSEIYTPGSPLFVDLKTGDDLSRPTKNKINASKPAYLS